MEIWSGSWFFTHPGSWIQGWKRPRIPDLQHCFFSIFILESCACRMYSNKWTCLQAKFGARERVRLGQAWRSGACTETLITVHNNKFMPRYQPSCYSTLHCMYRQLRCWDVHKFTISVSTDPIHFITFCIFWKRVELFLCFTICDEYHKVFKSFCSSDELIIRKCKKRKFLKMFQFTFFFKLKCSFNILIWIENSNFDGFIWMRISKVLYSQMYRQIV